MKSFPPGIQALIDDGTMLLASIRTDFEAAWDKAGRTDLYQLPPDLEKNLHDRCDEAEKLFRMAKYHDGTFAAMDMRASIREWSLPPLERWAREEAKKFEQEKKAQEEEEHRKSRELRIAIGHGAGFGALLGAVLGFVIGFVGCWSTMGVYDGIPDAGKPFSYAFVCAIVGAIVGLLWGANKR